MLERLEQWRQIKAADGAPVLDASPYNEWVYWDTLGYGNLPYDLVITNQLIASAEYYGVDIHSAIRGGVTVGTTSYSRTGKYGSYVFMSMFPFLDNSEHTKRCVAASNIRERMPPSWRVRIWRMRLAICCSSSAIRSARRHAR